MLALFRKCHGRKPVGIYFRHLREFVVGTRRPVNDARFAVGTSSRCTPHCKQMMAMLTLAEQLQRGVLCDGTVDGAVASHTQGLDR
jgi:hypothetical protein